MNNRLVDNRIALSRLIFDLGEFSEQELVERFWAQQKGQILIDGNQTIGDYLEELHSVGTLSLQDDRYCVVMRKLWA